MGSRILSDQQLEQAVEWYEGGPSVPRIVARFADAGTAVSQGSVSWHLLRLGADRPGARPRPLYSGNHFFSGGRSRPFTKEEDERLLAMEATGARISVIARSLGRGSNSIRGRLYTLARHDARSEGAGV